MPIFTVPSLYNSIITDKNANVEDKTIKQALLDQYRSCNSCNGKCLKCKEAIDEQKLIIERREIKEKRVQALIKRKGRAKALRYKKVYDKMGNFQL